MGFNAIARYRFMVELEVIHGEVGEAGFRGSEGFPSALVFEPA
ncbi:MAG: hypothetical protein QXR35_04425 [Candidatus Korarchaeum sp.]